MKTYARILFHDVEYWYNEHPAKELVEIDREHIIYNIINGKSSGEIFRDIEDSECKEVNEQYISGWWQIRGYESQ